MKNVIKSILLLIICLPVFSMGQTVSTLAGQGTGIDDALLLDSLGNIYGSGYDNGNIYKVTPNGTVSIFASGFQSANGLTWDGQGNLIVCDNVGNNVYKITRSGDISFIGFFGITSRMGFITYLDGYVYGTLFDGQRIMRMDSAGNAEWVAGSAIGVVDGPAVDARFHQPNGIVASRGGDSLIISGYGQKTLRVITGLDSVGFVGREMTPSEMGTIEVYPNPASDLLAVKFPQGWQGQVKVQILDLQGRVLIEKKVSGTEFLKISLERLKPGSYLLQMESEGSRQLKKIIVLRS